jgi:transposase InsO family protein
VVGKIVYLRQSYHFGPHKIAMYLKRYHDVQISPSGIWRILRRLDMSRLPASQRYRRHTDRWKRYEKPLPGHRVQIDVNRGVGHVYIKPATPRLNGKVERSHRIDQEEFYRMLEGVVIDDTELFNDRLQEWEDFYNFSRPHGALEGQTPYERRQKTRARA